MAARAAARQAWPFAAALLLIVLSLSVTERSMFGLLLSTLLLLLLGFGYVHHQLVFAFLRPSPFNRWLFFAALTALYFLALFYMSFGLYLDGGTMFHRSTPFVLDGRVTWQGYGFTASYAAVLLLASLLVCRKHRAPGADNG